MLQSRQSLEEDPLIYSENNDGLRDEDFSIPPRKFRHKPRIQCIAVLCLAIGIACGVVSSVCGRGSAQPHTVCKDPPSRREWRTLGDEQKQEYLNAVLCLKSIPSRLKMNQSLYDDFPWVHALIGGYCAWMENPFIHFTPYD